MKLCVSMLAWQNWDDPVAWRTLLDNGVNEIELVPTKIWPNWENFEVSSARRFATQLGDAGFRIPSAQSLAFGLHNVGTFNSDAPGGAFGQAARDARERFLTHLERVFSICAEFGNLRYVFGSPGLRKRGPLSQEHTNEIASDFFRRCGDSAARYGGVIALESNATAYGCDWLTTTTELAQFVEKLAHPSVRIHLDIGNMQMMSEDIPRRLAEVGRLSTHLHLSAPHMAPITRVTVEQFVEDLRAAGFSPSRVSLEQKFRSQEEFETSLFEFGRLKNE